MSKKEDIKAELTKLGIAFDETATTAELESLLPADDAVLKEPEDVISVGNLQIGDPTALRPTELPLVVKPPVGMDWLNDEQVRYAQTLNAAAYSNKMWAVPQKDSNGKDIPNSSIRDVELARLVEIGTNPDRYYFYTGEAKGEVPAFAIKNKLLGE